MASREDEQGLEATSSHRQEPADEHNYDATISTPFTIATFNRRSKPTYADIVKNVAKNLKSGSMTQKNCYSSGD